MRSDRHRPSPSGLKPPRAEWVTTNCAFRDRASSPAASSAVAPGVSTNPTTMVLIPQPTDLERVHAPPDRTGWTVCRRGPWGVACYAGFAAPPRQRPPFWSRATSPPGKPAHEQFPFRRRHPEEEAAARTSSRVCSAGQPPVPARQPSLVKAPSPCCQAMAARPLRRAPPLGPGPVGPCRSVRQKSGEAPRSVSGAAFEQQPDEGSAHARGNRSGNRPTRPVFARLAPGRFGCLGRSFGCLGENGCSRATPAGHPRFPDANGVSARPESRC